MVPNIKFFPKKNLVGKRLSMSFANNRTGELWKSFMVARNEIKNAVGPNRYSIQFYDSPLYFQNFNPNTIFEKWAAVEVESFDFVPVGFEKLVLSGGKYAVFEHKGLSSEIYQYIYGVWLPKSGYILDNRPHFDLLGEKYKQGSENSEEQIWVPVK
ncbi:MAG: GyrI-like domain-containing protein [Bacteroidota bacterium]